MNIKTSKEVNDKRSIDITSTQSDFRAHQFFQVLVFAQDDEIKQTFIVQEDQMCC